MEMFGVILLLVVAGFAIGAAVTSQKRSVVNAAWQSAASHRRLLFKPAELFSGPEIAGTLDGCQVRVDTGTRGGDSSKKYTRFRVEYPEPLGLGLKLTEQGVMSGVRRLLGAQDIEVGDSHFDQTVVVKGQGADQVIQFLSETRRHMVLAFFIEFPGARIGDTEVTWETDGVVEVTSGILNPIERMVELARCFGDNTSLIEEPAERELDDHRHEIVLEEPHEPPAPPPLEISPQKGSELPDIGTLVAPPEHAYEAEAESIAETVSDAHDVPTPPPVSAADTPLVAQSRPDHGPTTADHLSAQSVAEALFGGSIMSYQVKEMFAERFRGQRVQWSGILTSVASYPFDRIFGRTPGTKATITVHEPAGRAGRLSVKAVVQLPNEALGDLRSKTGKPVAFEGELLDCDGFMSSIFVGNGRVLWAGGD